MCAYFTANAQDTGRLNGILTHHLRNIRATLDALLYDMTTSLQILFSVIGIIRLPSSGSLSDCMPCLLLCCILRPTCNDSTVQRRSSANRHRMALLSLRKTSPPPAFPQYQVPSSATLPALAHMRTSAGSKLVLRASRWKASVLFLLRRLRTQAAPTRLWPV